MVVVYVVVGAEVLVVFVWLVGWLVGWWGFFVVVFVRVFLFVVVFVGVFCLFVSLLLFFFCFSLFCVVSVDYDDNFKSCPVSQRSSG